MTMIARIRRYPNWRMPRPKSVSGRRALSLAAIAPNAVRRPVSTTRTFAVPLWTEAPRKTTFVRAERAASGFTIPGRFSTGNDSPVMLASLTRKSFPSITRASAGMKLPAESRRRSPGTRVFTGTVEAGEPLDLVHARIAGDAAMQRRERQVLHHLREHELALVHHIPPPTSARRQDRPGRKSERGSNRHQIETALPHCHSSAYRGGAVERWDTTDAPVKVTAARARMLRPLLTAQSALAPGLGATQRTTGIAPFLPGSPQGYRI